MKGIQRFTVTINEDGKRLDRVLRPLLPEVPLGVIFKALRKKDILLNGKKADGSTCVREKDEISIKNPRLFVNKPKTTPEPVQIKLPPIIWENSHIIIFNKPAGLDVQGKGSLDVEVKKHMEKQNIPSLTFKSGPLHRIDRNTTGLVAFSKSLKGAREFSELMQSGMLEKFYLGIVEGQIEKSFTMSHRIENRKEKVIIGSSQEGKTALTIAYPILATHKATLTLFEIKTGRKHQIRAQLGMSKHPLWGDRKYGSTQKGRYFLHATALKIKKTSEIIPCQWVVSPIPENWKSFCKRELKIEENLLKKLYNEKELIQVIGNIQQVGKT